MASESKTEKATPKKRQDERKKGNIFQSNDVVSAISVLAIFFALKIWFPYLYKYLSAVLTKFIQYIKTVPTLSIDLLMDIFKDIAIAIFVVAGPIMLVAIVVAIIASGTQTKFKFSHEQIKLKFSRLSPIQGVKRLFSLRSVVELFKSIIKITIIVVVLFLEFKNLSSKFTTLLAVEMKQGIYFILDSIMNIVIKLSIVFIALAAFDYFYQWWEYERNIRMTKQEVKEEYKQLEGNPEIKGKIKEAQRKISMRRMMQQVPSADVIIRNPTHFAIALKYDTEKNSAPIVVAKGQDHVAFKIIEIAEKHHIPMKEDRPLARALYKAVEVNMEIPQEFYAALAEIMAWVYTLKKEAK